ncbi:MAG: hypothetical protein V3S89_03640 [Desulfobacterales bacterium]
MKCLRHVALSMTVLLLPTTAFSSFLITLKNSSTIITHSYMETDDQIKIYRYGGIIGIPKDSVASIADSDIEFVEPAPDPEELSAADKTDADASAEPVESPEEAVAKKTEKKSVDLSIYRKKKSELMEEYNSAKEELKKAIRARDRVAQKKATAKSRDIEKRRALVAKEIKEKTNGVLPSWWQ